MINVHGFQSVEEADVVSRSTRLLDKWHKENGYTDIAGQCRFCLEVVGKHKFRRHVVTCRVSNAADDSTCYDDDVKPAENDRSISRFSNIKW